MIDSPTVAGATTSTTSMLSVLSDDQLEVILPRLSDSFAPSVNSIPEPDTLLILRQPLESLSGNKPCLKKFKPFNNKALGL